MHRNRANLLFLGIVCLTGLFACKKDSRPPATPTRTIRYVLYTTQNFSNDNDTIRFRLSMKVGSTVLLDSPLAPIRVSQIPDAAHKLTFDKIVPAGYDDKDLQVGFLYQIDNVGMSWFLDSCKAGEALKTIDYNFK